MTADVSVVIGNHQGEHLLADCISSLERQAHRLEEVVVVDGGSSDTSVAVAEANGARVLRHENVGLGFLYNRGVDAVSSRYVLLLNNDVALDPDCVARLVAALEEDSDRFAADPMQVDWNQGRVIHARTTIQPGRMLREYLPGLHLDPIVPANSISPTVCANAAAMLVRRSMFVELGGFDETFFMEWEDLDLCWRGWLRDWPTVYVPEARVRHRVGAVTTPDVTPRRSASSHHNLMRFALKCLPPSAALRVVIGELLRAPAHPRAVTGGLRALMPEIHGIWQCRRKLRPTAEAFAALIQASA